VLEIHHDEQKSNNNNNNKIYELNHIIKNGCEIPILDWSRISFASSGEMSSSAASSEGRMAVEKRVNIQNTQIQLYEHISQQYLLGH
jgi:hypothetical protein